MADVLDIVDFTSVQAAVGVPNDAEKLALLAGYVTTVSRHIDDLCGPVVQRTVTGELHHGGGRCVALRKYPVVSVTTVTENGATVAAAGYHLDVDSGLLERVSSYSSTPWLCGRWNVAVTYEAGRYADTATVDPIFAAAATMAVKGLWTSQQAGHGSVAFGAYGGDLNDNADAPGLTSYVLPKAAYMLLRGGNYIQSKVAIA